MSRDMKKVNYEVKYVCSVCLPSCYLYRPIVFNKDLHGWLKMPKVLKTGSTNWIAAFIMMIVQWLLRVNLSCTLPFVLSNKLLILTNCWHLFSLFAHESKGWLNVPFKQCVWEQIYSNTNYYIILFDRTQQQYIDIIVSQNSKIICSMM